MRMRPLIPLLLAPALLAQAPSDPAEARAAEMKADRDPASPKFLWLRPQDQLFQGPWELDPDYGPVAAAREITYAAFNEGEAEAWARHLGWAPGGHWLLLSPEGEPLLSGMAAPEASALLDAMRSTGWMPRQERLVQFLREHPDNGDAWVEALLNADNLAGREANIARRLSGAKPLALEDRLNPPPLDETADQARWGAAAKAMDGLMGVEGWTRSQKLQEILVTLEVNGARGSALLKDPFQRMRRSIEDALQRDPESVELWMLWSFLTDLAPGGDAEGFVGGLDAPPGSPWPPTAAASPIGEALNKAGRWVELEAIASRAYARGMDPAVLPYLANETRLSLVREWGFWRVVSLARMDRRDDAGGVLKKMKAQYGPQWPDQASGPLAESLAYYLGQDDPLIAALKAAKTEKAPPEPSLPGFPSPLHLVLLGHPAWEREWTRYAGLSAFEAWEPDAELGWQPLKPEEERVLRARLRWGAEPRWALLRGAEVLASGSTLPKPAFLADRLRAEGAPYLEQLDAFLRTHPDRLDARKARLDELHGRMPNERLEAVMLDDARITLKPFKQAMEVVDQWTPRKELWEPAARKMLPELEIRLRRWPERADLWESWFEWSSLLDHPPSPAQFLANLDIWKTRFDGGPGPLPSSILQLGSEMLSRQGRWVDLADWCACFWEGGERDQLRRLNLSAALPRQQSDSQREEKSMIKTDLLSPYRDALEKLGRTAQLRAFIQEVGDIDPAMAKLLTASAMPPRPGR